MNRKLLLLGILREQEMHGYELHDFINTRLSSCTDMKKSTAYYLLKKMEEEGLLSQETRQEGNRPPRQVYQLTSAGEVEFQYLLRENLTHHHRAYFTDDIGMVFLGTLPVQEAFDLLSNRRNELREALQETQDFPTHVESLQLVFDHLIHHLHSELDWIEKVLAQLEQDQE